MTQQCINFWTPLKLSTKHLLLCIALFIFVWSYYGYIRIAKNQTIETMNDAIFTWQQTSKKIATQNLTGYSNFKCLTEHNRIIGFASEMNERYNSAICSFINICYSLESNEWIYFENDQLAHHLIYNLFRNGTNVYGRFNFFIKTFWSNIQPQIINYSINNFCSANSMNKCHTLDRDAYALVDLYTPENFGHNLFDDVFWGWKILTYFNSYHSKNSGLIFLRYLNEYDGEMFIKKRKKGYNSKEIKRAISFYDESTKYLFEKGYLFITNDFDKESYSHICIKNGIIGGVKEQLNFGNSRSDKYLLSQFIINNFHQNNRFPIHQQKIFQLMRYGKQKVALVTKQKGIHLHQRGFVNEDLQNEIVNPLKEYFGINVFDILYDSNIEKLSLTEQINLVLNYTVLIIPAGGLGLFGTFMCNGCSLVVLDYFDIRINKTSHMEGHIWESLTHLKVFYYPIDINDIELINDLSYLRKNMKKIDPWVNNIEYGIYKDLFNYKLKLNKLKLYLFNAMYYVEKQFGWHNSFTISHDI